MSRNSSPHDSLTTLSLYRGGISVAESVKALQSRGHTPCSPKTLRRAHSVASPYQQPQQLQQQKPKTREEIYAPVAKLQAKIAQKQQQQQLLQQQQALSPDGDKYGFGMKFQTHQSHFYNHVVEVHSPPEQLQQAMAAHAQQGSTFGGQQQQQQPQQYDQHDQIMRDVDVKLRARPQPPPMMAGTVR